MEVNLSKERVLELVERKGISKAEFARMLGYDRKNLDTYLSAKNKSINLVIKIAEALDLSLYELLDMQEPEKEIYGCLYVKGIPTLVNNKDEIQAILQGLSK